MPMYITEVTDVLKKEWKKILEVQWSYCWHRERARMHIDVPYNLTSGKMRQYEKLLQAKPMYVINIY